MADGTELVDELIECGLVVQDRPTEVPGIPRPLGDGETTHPVDYPRLKRGELRDEEHPELSRLAEHLPQLAGTGPEGIDHGLEARIRETGLFDICAWYQPIHFYGRNWGIFIREECVLDLAWLAARFMDPSVIRGPYPLQLARELIVGGCLAFFLHEHFHHKVEAFGIRLWVVEDTARYVPYKTGVYRPTLLTDDNLEEALANADSRRRFSTPPYSDLQTPVRTALRATLDWTFRRSPGGYRRAPDYLGSSFRPGRWQLQAQIQEATLTPRQDGRRWRFATHSVRSLRGVNDRIWAVLRRGRRPLLP